MIIRAARRLNPILKEREAGSKIYQADHKSLDIKWNLKSKINLYLAPKALRRMPFIKWQSLGYWQGIFYV
jgi:hypothetical protein